MITQAVPFGQGTMSNVSLQVNEMTTDLFTLNTVFFPNSTYTNRGSLDRVRAITAPLNLLIQHNKDGEVYYTSGKKFIRSSTGLTISSTLQDGVYHSGVNVGDDLFITDTLATYKYDGASFAVATQIPRKFFVITNSVSLTAGNPTATFKYPAHGLVTGQQVGLEGFGFGLNIDSATITVSDPNTFTITYGTNFPATLDNIGGSGLLTAFYDPINFPVASTIASFRNRLYLAGDLALPNRLYISNLINPASPGDIRFEENTDDILNLGFAAETTASQTIDIPSVDGKIIGLYPGDYGVYIAMETCVYFFNGLASDALTKVVHDDTFVNPRAVTSRAGYTYFVGYHNLYMSRAGQTLFTPIGTPHEYFFKNKDPDAVRLVYFDNLMIATLGSVKNFENDTIPRLPTADGDLPDFKEETNLAIVIDTRIDKFTFFSNFNVQDFEIVKTDGRLELWMGNGSDIVKYNPLGSKDYSGNIPIMILTAPHAFTDISQKKNFEKVHVYHQRSNAGLELKYKTIGKDAGVNFESAKLIDTESGTYISVFEIKAKQTGRLIQLLLTSGGNLENRTFNGYQIEFSTPA